MKIWLVALLGFAVSGCAAHKTATYRGNPMDQCSVAAEERAQDGALNGYNEDLLKRVFIDTYTDCKKHEAAYTFRADLRKPPQDQQARPDVIGRSR